MRVRWWAPAAVGLLLLAASAGRAPARPAPSAPPGSPNAATQPFLTCPRALPAIDPGSDAATDGPLAPRDPIKAVLCVYAGMNNSRVTYRSLIESVVVRDPAVLAEAVNDSVNYEWSGVTSCPADDGAADVVLFAGPDGWVTPVGMGVTGCASAWSSRSKSYYPLSPSAAAMLVRLEGSLRSGR